MAITLAQAKLNATDAVDINAIDEFSTSALLDQIIFDDVVNPAGGGATLTYGYTRKATLSSAGFRQLNTEYAPNEATKVRASVDLKVLGGAFQIDRVLAKVGPAATGEVAFQMKDKIAAAQAAFADATINGDATTDPESFDGLSKILAGSSTEVSTEINWAGVMDENAAFGVLESLDELLALMDGDPTLIVTNRKAIARIKAAARRTSMYTETPGPLGTMVAKYGNATLFDAGKTAGANTDIIPVVAGVTELYAVRSGLSGFHGVSTVGGNLVSTWLPDFTQAGAVKTGEVEMGPVAVVLKSTKAAAVARAVRIAAA